MNPVPDDAPMLERYSCQVENATVRPDKHETLDRLITKLFERRHQSRMAGQESDWLAAELVQTLRRESVVYRDVLSSDTDGPLPFAVGYFRRRGDQLELVSDQIPANVAPKILVQFLSEFVQPGARFWFRKGEEGWVVRGIGEVDALLPCESS